MSIYRVVLAVLCISLCRGGEVVFLNKPDYIQLFQAEGTLKLSQLQYAISAWFGFTLHKDIEYGGILASQPFSHPQAVAVLSLFNGRQLLSQIGGERIKTADDEDFVPTHNLEHVLDKFYNADSNVYKLDLDAKVADLDGRLEGLDDNTDTIVRLLSDKFNLAPGDGNSLEVQHFLRQLSLAYQAVQRVREDDSGVADLLTLELALPADVAADVKSELESAVRLLIDEIKAVLTEKFGTDYVLLAVSWSEAKHSVNGRRTRSLMQTSATEKPTNMADPYSDDYAAIFHIILWLMVSMAVLITYIIHGMFTMDPGSDSIIYRMTTTRLKRD